MAGGEQENTMKKHKGHFQNEQRTAAAWMFLAPAMSAIVLFFVVPVLSALLMSMTDFDIYALGNLKYVRFMGLQNYMRILETPLFWTAMRNTMYLWLLEHRCLLRSHLVQRSWSIQNSPGSSHFSAPSISSLW